MKTKQRSFLRPPALCLVIAALALMALIQTDRVVEAARPGELARLVPGTPLVLLESDDLPGLVAQWRDCDLRTPVENSLSYRGCTASRLGLRLAERRNLISNALAEPISLDQLARMPGNRGGIAIYNVSETSFVFWLRTHHGAGEDLAVLQPELEVERVERNGHRYMVHHGGEETAEVALAVVGDLLIFGNDIPHFEQALTLAVSEEGTPLARDSTYRALIQRTPVSGQVHLYLDMGRLVGTRQFQRRWVHDNVDDLAGIDRAMISVTWEERRTLEHRVLAYREGGRRLPAGAEAGATPQERINALPAGSYSSLSRIADAREAAGVARWLWPSETEGASEDLVQLLSRAGPTLAVEVHRPSSGRDGFQPSDAMAVAFLLESPEALTTSDVVDAAEAAMIVSLSKGRTIAPERRRAPGRGVVATDIRAPLPGSPSLSISRSSDGAVLVLGTSARIVNELARAADPAANLGEALRSPGADVIRVDYHRASQLIRRRLDLITTDEEYGRYGSLAFLGEEVPELLEAPEIARIERLAWRDGNFDRQEVRFIE